MCGNDDSCVFGNVSSGFLGSFLHDKASKFSKLTYVLLFISFALQIVSWYNTNKRDLPWRHTKDPYLIWLSEIILQQTRVNQGLPYYYKFIEQFPTVSHLAEASEQQVLKLWQ